jgi:hypothetical protein
MHVKPDVKTNKSDYIDAHAFRRQAFAGGRWEHDAVVHDCHESGGCVHGSRLSVSKELGMAGLALGLMLRLLSLLRLLFLLQLLLLLHVALL